MGFDIGFVSALVRARETAGLLGDISNGHREKKGKEFWEESKILRERDFGWLDCVPLPDNLARYQEEIAGRTVERLFWAAVGGESLNQAQTRPDRFHMTMKRYHSMHRVVAVSHGDLILSEILHQTRMSYEEFYDRKQEKDPLLELDNCQVVEFSRVNPETGQISDKVDWVRTCCPWKMKEQGQKLARNEGWQRIIRPNYSSAMLLERAEQYPYLLSE